MKSGADGRAWIECAADIEPAVDIVAAKFVKRDDGNSGIAELEGIFLCGGTGVLTEASENLKLLGNGRLPQ
jgi:hypothetical protein